MMNMHTETQNVHFMPAIVKPENLSMGRPSQPCESEIFGFSGQLPMRAQRNTVHGAVKVCLCLAIAFACSRAYCSPLQQIEMLQNVLRAAEPDNQSAGLIDLLRTHSELLSEVKLLVASESSNRSLDRISDEALYSRIEQDSGVRLKITDWLSLRGYRIGASGGQLPLQSDRVTKTALPTYGSASYANPDALDEDPNRAKVTYQATPYPQIPSARDLYTQIPSEALSSQRFGIEIFRNRTGNQDAVTIDLPAGPEYVLGPGDGVEIEMWGGISQRITRTVDREGRIALPEAGTIVVAGLTLAKAQESIQRVLTPQIRNVQVDVSLARLRSVRVYVVGDVERPGAYDVSSLSTPLNALYAAGGPTSRGSLRNVQHFRNSKCVRVIDLYEFLLHGVRPDDDRLLSGDTILVPPVGAQITVSGMVRRPAIYEVSTDQDLARVLDLAGGVLVSATLQQVRIERIEAHERRTTLTLELPGGRDKDAASAALRAFRVQDGDQIVIGSILPHSDKTVYLEGHVARPGRYTYKEGMTASDLIRSWSELLPEPASKAELVRLVPPDFHPEAQHIDLSEVLSGDHPVALKPFDTVRVLGRYEADPPKVAIHGEVLRPGEYPLSDQMTAAALVRLAGGTKRSAYTESADLATYTVQDGKKILTQHHEFPLGKALAGDSSADRTLRPQDVITIRQLSGWGDIGSSASISGEVMYPGTYGIQDGEKLSSFILRAGGFRSTAYPEGAVLERVQVRQMAEKSREELIQHLETAALTTSVTSEDGQKQAETRKAMEEQRERVLSSLRKRPPTGRLVVHLASDINRWKDTSEDIQLRAGDVLTVPKRPDFVLISGQIYNPSAITFNPGHKAGWYLARAGGPTELANRKAIFIIRADGSVVSTRAGAWHAGVLDSAMAPGDTIVVPEKIISGSNVWRNLLGAAQITGSLALAAGVVAGL